ncbi:hypothetical protein D3C72_1522460 [compost metagenome]
MQRVNIDAVVQGLDAFGRPFGQAFAHVVTHRVGDAEQTQALPEEVGKQLTTAALIVTKGMMHADYRQAAAEQGDVDRLETVSNTEAEIARGDDSTQCANRPQLKATDGLGAELEEDHFVRGAAGRYLRVGCASQEHRGDLVAAAVEQAGVLPCAVQERPVIAVAELQDALFSLGRHKCPHRP